MEGVFSVGMVHIAQGLEALFALYLPTPGQSGLLCHHTTGALLSYFSFKLTSTCFFVLL